MAKRFTKYLAKDIRAYCETCDIDWTAKNAQGVAARHTQTTGHSTRVDIDLDWRYTMEEADR